MNDPIEHVEVIVQEIHTSDLALAGGALRHRQHHVICPEVGKAVEQNSRCSPIPCSCPVYDNVIVKTGHRSGHPSGSSSRKNSGSGERPPTQKPLQAGSRRGEGCIRFAAFGLLLHSLSLEDG
jgi:hypothetical protein